VSPSVLKAADTTFWLATTSLRSQRVASLSASSAAEGDRPETLSTSSAFRHEMASGLVATSFLLTDSPSKHSSQQKGKHRTVTLGVPDMTRGRFSGQASSFNDEKRHEPFQRAAYVDRVYLERSTVPSGVVIKSSCCPHAVWYVT
jgi:hypothetical protein